GSNIFNGSKYWLEVRVRPALFGAPYGFPLLPRQPIIGAPYALYAANAGSANNANTAITATTATTATTASNISWAGIANKPAGFDDDVDDNTTYTNGAGLNLTGTAFS